jgi:hypothetical protein
VRRWLFNIATAVSLTLCIATVLLWTRAQFASDLLDFDLGNHEVQLWTIKRCFFFGLATPPYHLVPTGFQRSPAFEGRPYSDFVIPKIDNEYTQSGTTRSYRWLGFYLQPTYYQAAWSGHPAAWFTLAGVPFYAMFALTALLPALRLRGWIKRRGRRLGNHCSKCGYDLRATPDRCPECGTESADETRAGA